MEKNLAFVRGQNIFAAGLDLTHGHCLPSAALGEQSALKCLFIRSFIVFREFPNTLKWTEGILPVFLKIISKSTVYSIYFGVLETSIKFITLSVDGQVIKVQSQRHCPLPF